MDSGSKAPKEGPQKNHQAATAAIAVAALILAALLLGGKKPVVPPIPQIEGEWWTIAGNPDLGNLGSPNQEPVDFAVWQAADGSWQLLSCIRKTNEPGRGRVFYRWQGRHPTARDWEPMGVAMQGDPEFGELPGGLQAPYVLRWADAYHMLYGSGLHVSLAIGVDGKQFRPSWNSCGSGIFSEPLGVWDEEGGFYLATHARDPMVLQIGETFYAYYTANPARQGGVYLRTSTDLKQWGASRRVRFGGVAGTSGVSAECPFVVYHGESGYYYLFTTQRYGREAISSVYRSKDPAYFGIDEDEGYLVTRLPVAAPEIVQVDGQYYIAALRPELDGIQMARLEWVAESGGR